MSAVCPEALLAAFRLPAAVGLSLDREACR
jgi:hypothetical protein